jgi:hypothetical protein
MAKKQSKAGRIQTAKNKKKVQDALHDAVATDDDDVECPTPIERNPNQENQRPRRRKTKKRYRMHCTMQSPHTTMTLNVLLQSIRNPNKENQRPFHLRRK